MGPNDSRDGTADGGAEAVLDGEPSDRASGDSFHRGWRFDPAQFADREGPFWDILAGRATPPPIGRTLGWRVEAVDPDAGTIEISFQAVEDFLNPIGTVQGGILAAMLDDTLGPALVATLGPGLFAPTLDIQVQYHRPAQLGTFIGRGRVVRRTRDVGFLAGELVDAEGRVVATATATALIKQMPLA